MHDETLREKLNHAVDSTQDSLAQVYATLSRMLASYLSFMFQRPIRLFRPVKVSAFRNLKGLARASGTNLSYRFLIGTAKLDGGSWSFISKRILPPVLVNGILGFTIFSTYTYVEHTLVRALPPTAPISFQNHVFVPFASGAAAGAAQGILSAPLDNVRIILQDSYDKNAKLVSMSNANPLSVLREVIFGPEKISLQTMTPEQRQRAHASFWARRGPLMWTISIVKDAAGFGAFFALFDCGRVLARRVGLVLDGVPWSSTPKFCLFHSDAVDVDSASDVPSRSVSSKAVQASIMIFSGAAAGAIHASAERPFNLLRDSVYRLRMTHYDAAHAFAPRSAELYSIVTVYKTLRKEYKSHPLRNPFTYTRNSFRKIHRDVASAGFTEASRRFFVRSLMLVPPYALGFLAYAVAAGDFS